MTRPVSLLPEAEEDVRQAMRWYDAKRPGLGAEFVGAIEASLGRIAQMPLVSAVWPPEPRFYRARVRRFPYLIFFELRDETVEITAVAHERREPRYWLKRH